ncbi:hypothetical protein N7931_16215 [Catenovulum sp. 2E275]|uniref:hypothetical protein n=1 Tax=Catenovulum sp. 2E275 TaxID=2980497 RepID=UPI0021D2A4DA|nr:hypothetical protein [Catenovulum sp. 2E275]MCU4677174.1 hypothetical protein [Catenovulum sp. 2E275]
MENLISAIQVNITLLALAMFITFIVLGATEKAENADALKMARIENAFFAVSSLAVFLIFWLI